MNLETKEVIKQTPLKTALKYTKKTIGVAVPVTFAGVATYDIATSENKKETIYDLSTELTRYAIQHKLSYSFGKNVVGRTIQKGISKIALPNTLKDTSATTKKTTMEQDLLTSLKSDKKLPKDNIVFDIDGTSVKQTTPKPSKVILKGVERYGTESKATSISELKETTIKDKTELTRQISEGKLVVKRKSYVENILTGKKDVLSTDYSVFKIDSVSKQIPTFNEQKLSQIITKAKLLKTYYPELNLKLSVPNVKSTQTALVKSLPEAESLIKYKDVDTLLFGKIKNTSKSRKNVHPR